MCEVREIYLNIKWEILEVQLFQVSGPTKPLHARIRPLKKLQSQSI